MKGVRCRSCGPHVRQLPDTMEDDWIQSEQHLDWELRKHADTKARLSAFDVRWDGTATGQGATPCPGSLAVWMGDLHHGAGPGGRGEGAG